MMDSTTITLFDNILKGVGRHPKSGKKKGGMKVHTVMKYHVGVPMVVQLTSATKHDHYLLKEVHLPKDSTLAMDRGYIDIAQFQRLTEEGVCYVTKMKKNLNYKVLKSTTYVNPDGLVTHIDQKVQFTRGELTHEARRLEIFNEKKKPVVLLTNNFEFSVEDISEIYRLRWAIESLYKQLKQNFPLHFFYGDSANAIQIQTWVVLIANLLITVLSRSIKRNCVSLRLSLWCALRLCTILILSHLWKILTKHGTIFWPRRNKKHHQNLLFSIRRAYFWKKEVRSLILMGFEQDYYARLSFTGQQ